MYSGDGSDSFPSFEDMYNQLNEDLLKEKVKETVREGKVPKPMTKEEIAEAKKS